MAAAGPSMDFIERSAAAGCPDMISMRELSHESILGNLRTRFEESLVYTHIGDIVTSVNPFKATDGSRPGVQQRYLDEKVTENVPSVLPPHVFSLVSKAYRNMLEYNRSQSILVSGESGAGKTEAMKIAIGHLSKLSDRDAKMGSTSALSNVGDRVMSTNDVMEPIGNARTTRNNNSSRFGKHIDIEFSADAQLLGAKTSVYLLEKPRICKVGALSLLLIASHCFSLLLIASHCFGLLRIASD